MPFSQSFTPMLPGHAPESRKCRGGSQVADVDVGVPVSLASESKDRVWPRVHFPADAPREVDAEKRKARIRDRINQRTHQRGALGNQIIVFAAKWDDHRGWLVSRHAANAVAVKSRAINQCVRCERAAGRLDRDFILRTPDAGRCGRGENTSTARSNQFSVFLADQRVVRDSGRWNYQRLQTRRVRLDLAQFLGTDQPQTRQPVGLSALAQFFQPGQFVFACGDDDFSTHVVRNAMLAAELHHCGGSRHAQPRLQRTGLVVDAGVNYAAVVPALVAGNSTFLLQHQQALAREAAGDLQPYTEANGAATDDDYVVARIGHAKTRPTPGLNPRAACWDLLVYDERHGCALARIRRGSR